MVFPPGRPPQFIHLERWWSPPLSRFRVPELFCLRLGHLCGPGMPVSAERVPEALLHILRKARYPEVSAWRSTVSRLLRGATRDRPCSTSVEEPRPSGIAWGYRRCNVSIEPQWGWQCWCASSLFWCRLACPDLPDREGRIPGAPLALVRGSAGWRILGPASHVVFVAGSKGRWVATASGLTEYHAGPPPRRTGRFRVRKVAGRPGPTCPQNPPEVDPWGC